MSSHIVKTSFKRPCPVCHHTLSRSLFHQSFEALTGVTFLDGYDVVICEQCGAGFADGIPPQQAFDVYYRDLSKYEHADRGGKESPSDELRYREVADAVATFIPSSKARILEIGCATGRLLSMLKEAGFENVQGLDPSPQCVRAAWDLYKIPAFAGSIFGMEPPAEPYDFVIACGVLEHIEDVTKAIECVRSIVSERGRVYIEVPDATRIAGRPDAPYQEFSTEHINFFSPSSMANLFTLNGFVRIAWDRAIRPLHGDTCAATYGVFERTDDDRGVIERDAETEPGLCRYIGESQSEDSRIRTTLRDSARGRPIIVWGAGTHTLRLLATGAFSNIDIAGFVDSNPKYQGQMLQGRPVLSPSEIIGRNEPILISSRGFQAEIRDQIRNSLGLKNDLILLYGV